MLAAFFFICKVLAIYCTYLNSEGNVLPLQGQYKAFRLIWQLFCSCHNFLFQ